MGKGKVLSETQRELFQRLIEIDSEIESRRLSDALACYNTGDKVHLKQVAFHKCPKRNRWVFGGNRSGKTECGAVETVYLARGIHPYRKNKDDVRGWVVSLSARVQRDVAQSKILRYLKKEWIEEIIMAEGRADSAKNGVIDKIIVKNVFGGRSEIGFKSCEMGREKFQGTSLDFVWFDEEPPKDIYDECKMRVLDRCGDIFGTMTPLKGLTFLYDEIYLNKYKSKEVWFEFMEWSDNPYLDEKEVEFMTETLSDDVLETRRYGRFSQGEGLVYREFDENKHVIDPFDFPKEWQSGISIDPGLNNPLSCHFYAVDYDGNIYVVAEHYERGQNVLHHADAIKKIALSLDWKKNRDGALDAYIDSAANQTTLASQKSVSTLFYEQGIAVNPKVNKNLFAGISRVKEYLKTGRLFIFSNCVNMIREIKGYYWGKDDAPVKRDDHAMDELRYFIMTMPSSPNKTQELSAIQKDKEKLIRRKRR